MSSATHDAEKASRSSSMLWSNGAVAGDYPEQSAGSLDMSLLMPTSRRPLVQTNIIQANGGAHVPLSYMHAQGELFPSNDPPKDATAVAPKDLEFAGTRHGIRNGASVYIPPQFSHLKPPVGAIGDGRKPKMATNDPNDSASQIERTAVILRSLNLTPPVAQQPYPPVPPLLMPGNTQNSAEHHLPHLMTRLAFDPFAGNVDTPSTVSPTTPTSYGLDLPTGSLDAAFIADNRTTHQNNPQSNDFLKLQSTPFENAPFMQNVNLNPHAVPSPQLPFKGNTAAFNYASYINTSISNDPSAPLPTTNGTTNSDGQYIPMILGSNYSRSPTSPLFARSPSPYWRHLPDSQGARADGWVPSIPVDVGPNYTPDEQPIQKGHTHEAQSLEGVNRGRGLGINHDQPSGLANIPHPARFPAAYESPSRRHDFTPFSATVEYQASSQYKMAPTPNRVVKDYIQPWTGSARVSNPATGNQGTSPSQVASARLFDDDELLQPNARPPYPVLVHRIIKKSDQQASIFIQQKLKNASSEERSRIVGAIVEKGLEMMQGRFGNWCVQRCLESPCTREDRLRIVGCMTGRVVELATNCYGTHVIQKALDCDEDIKRIIVDELLANNPAATLTSKHCSHVWAKIMELSWHDGPAPPIFPVVHRSLRGKWASLACHETGSLVVQTMFENMDDLDDKRTIVDEILANLDEVVKNQWGAFVIQHIIEHGDPQVSHRTSLSLITDLAVYGTHDVAVKSILKILKEKDSLTLEAAISKMCEPNVIGNRGKRPIIVELALSSNGSQIIQAVLPEANKDQRTRLYDAVKGHTVTLRGCKTGSRVIWLFDRMRAYYGY